MRGVISIALIALSPACLGGPKPTEINDLDALLVLTAVLKDRGGAGWDVETRCRFLKGGGFSREEARFVIEAASMYGQELDKLAARRSELPTPPGLVPDPKTVEEIRILDEQSGKILESLQKDLQQLKGGALKAKLEALLFLMKPKIFLSPSHCQVRIGRLLAYTAMSESSEGRMTALALTISNAWTGHKVQAKTVLKGPPERIATMLSGWGSESAAAAWLDGGVSGLFVGESEHYETCAESNLTKFAGSTRGTKLHEPSARASLQ
jgi:hypothetical protein